MPEPDEVLAVVQEVLQLSARFRRIGVKPEKPLEVETHLGIGARVPEVGKLAVDLRVHAVAPDLFEVEVEWRAIFQISPEMPRDEVKQFAALVGPTTLYPYARKSMATLVMESGLKPFLVPVVNFGQVVDVETFSMSWPEDEDEDETSDETGGGA